MENAIDHKINIASALKPNWTTDDHSIAADIADSGASGRWIWVAADMLSWLTSISPG
jgi:hypothetical protein